MKITRNKGIYNRRITMCDKGCSDCNGGPVHVPVEKEMKNTNEFGVVHLFIRRECAVCGKMMGDTMVRRIQ